MVRALRTWLASGCISATTHDSEFGLELTNNRFLLQDDVAARSLLCPTCNHDLAGASGHCPACETSLAEAAAFRLREAGLNEAGWVVAPDRLCVRCGYSLVGTHFDSACPECNWPVRRSVYAGHIAYAPPAWIEQLQTGATYVCAGIAALWATLLLGVTVFTPGLSGGFLTVGLTLGLLVAIGLPLLGGWMLTKAPPQPLDAPIDRRQRLIIRIAIFVTAGMIPFVVALSRTGMPPLGRVFSVGGAAAGLAGLIGLLTYLNHVERFSARWLSADVAEKITRLRRMAWVWLAACFCLVVMQSVLLSHGADWASILGYAAVASFVLHTGSAWMLHVRMITALNEPLQSARWNWPDPKVIGPPPPQPTLAAADL